MSPLAGVEEDEVGMTDRGGQERGYPLVHHNDRGLGRTEPLFEEGDDYGHELLVGVVEQSLVDVILSRGVKSFRWHLPSPPGSRLDRAGAASGTGPA